MTWQLIAAITIALAAFIGYVSIGESRSRKAEREEAELPRDPAPMPVNAYPADPAVFAHFQQALKEQMAAARR